ncbi:MAG: FAD:protein FMN transferase [Bacteroidota bacterium]
MKNINLFYDNYFGMNTLLEVVLWGQSELKQQRCFNQISAGLTLWEKILSRFDEEAETFVLNEKAVYAPVKVSTELWQSIRRCITYRELTHGLFDVFYLSDQSQEKSVDELLRLDTAHQTVHFVSSDTQVDFGGIGKGIFLEEVIRILDENEMENAFVSFGGSSIHSRGRHPHHEASWPFSFQPQFGMTEELSLTNTNLSISGLQSGNAHIYSPEENGLISTPKCVAVQGQSPVSVEVLSTSLIVADHEKQASMIKKIESEDIYYGVGTVNA